MIRLVGKTAVVMLLAMAIGCTATRTQKTAGEQFDDTVTTARVKAALASDPVVKATQVDLEVFRGVVQLNGFVDSSAARNQASEVAKRVDGVTEVRNNLSVRSEPRSAGEVVDDAGITANVKAALAADDRVRALRVNVETREGVVQLSGFVNDATAKQAAAEVARGVDKVVRVDNQIDVKQR